METKGFFLFETIINVLVSSMLWVYGHYTYFNSFNVETVFICQNLTSTDVLCAVALYGLAKVTYLNIPGKIDNNIYSSFNVNFSTIILQYISNYIGL